MMEQETRETAFVYDMATEEEKTSYIVITYFTLIFGFFFVYGIIYVHQLLFFLPERVARLRQRIVSLHYCIFTNIFSSIIITNILITHTATVATLPWDAVKNPTVAIGREDKSVCVLRNNQDMGFLIKHSTDCPASITSESLLSLGHQDLAVHSDADEWTFGYKASLETSRPWTYSIDRAKPFINYVYIPITSAHAFCVIVSMIALCLTQNQQDHPPPSPSSQPSSSPSVSPSPETATEETNQLLSVPSSSTSTESQDTPVDVVAIELASV
jgi:hypothetical protein